MTPLSEVLRTPSSQPRSGSAAKARDSSRRVAEPPLEVMPITVWSPPDQSAAPPSSRAEELRGKSPKADGDDDSLLSPAELTTGTVSSVLREYDIKRSGALPVEEALALSIQGVTSISSVALLRFAFILGLSCVLTSSWALAGGYSLEEFGQEG